MFWMRNYGYKYKMSNLQAAMGLGQIERIEELVAKKRQIFNWYSELLKNIPCKMNPEYLNFVKLHEFSYPNHFSL